MNLAIFLTDKNAFLKCLCENIDKVITVGAVDFVGAIVAVGIIVAIKCQWNTTTRFTTELVGRTRTI